MAYFFEVNREIFLFIYGEVFFIMGLAIALQSRHYSRLELSRSLRWLAAFGLLHGVYEWGSLFIPIQAQFVSPELAHIFYILHITVLSLSFLFLFEFGIALLHVFRPIPHGFSLGLFFFWLLVWISISLPLSDDKRLWLQYGNAMARYFIAFPGALMASYGLFSHTQKQIQPLNVPHLLSTFQIASIALLFYAFFGGLVSPPITSFPGNVVNTATFQALFGFPVLIVRSTLGLILAITIIRGLEIFDIETIRKIEAMEHQQILALERERISRELHDGALQTVYTAGLLVESATRLAEPGSSIAVRMGKSIFALKDAIAALRGYLTELNPENQGIGLEEALRQAVSEPHFSSFLEIKLNCRLPDREALLPLSTDHILAILRESLANIIRHANAHHVEITAQSEEGFLKLSIMDDGIGLPENINSGYGLRNMHDRARLLGGKLEIQGSHGKGTCVTLRIPLKGG